jgi:hypothetical protein
LSDGMWDKHDDGDVGLHADVWVVIKNAGNREGYRETKLTEHIQQSVIPIFSMNELDCQFRRTRSLGGYI